MNLPVSSNSEEFRVFDLFSPNELSDAARERRRTDAARVSPIHTHVNPAAARDSFVFANPLFAPSHSDNKR